MSFRLLRRVEIFVALGGVELREGLGEAVERAAEDLHAIGPGEVRNEGGASRQLFEVVGEHLTWK